MNKFIVMGSLLFSGMIHSKSYFVKLNSTESLQALKANKSIQNVREVKTSIAPFAVIESDMKLETLKGMKSLDVAYIEPNDIDYTINSKPADADYSKQWGVNGSYGIQAERVWASQKGSRDVIVAVVDTGIDTIHPDLKDNLWTNEAELNGEEGVDDDGNGYVDDIYGINSHDKTGDPMDGNGHGTHCAGVIGASHNQIGIAGVMANVQMMGVKIFTDAGRTTVEAIVLGIDYAIQNGAKIMSNSWGGSQFSQAIFDAVKAADDAGILFIAAAGNGNIFGIGFDTDDKKVYPAGYELDNVVSVGSIASNGSRSRFSNFGKLSVDLFAPGSNVYSTYKGQSYKSLSGTSMATPHASGVAGLIASQYPDADDQEIKSLLIDGVRKLRSFSNNSVSGGILNAPGALGL